MVNVLSAYPLSVIERLTNETSAEALQLKHKWPPKLAEIKEAAEAIMTERAREDVRRTRLEQQRAETEARMQPRGDRPSYDELKAKFGPTFGIDVNATDSRLTGRGERITVIGGQVRKVVEKPFAPPTADELRAYYVDKSTESNSLTGSAGKRKGTKAHVSSERSQTPSAGATDRISEDQDCSR